MNEETFHHALRENPLDELAWSALADYLDDIAQTDRAELLRLTRRMAMIPLVERGDMPGRVDALLQAGVKPVVVQRVNALGMRFSLVMPGCFLMGSPADEKGRDQSEKQHEVTLTIPFWMGVFAVTQKQWKAVMGKNPSWFRSRGGGKAEVKGMNTDDFPVEQVSWEDGQAFLKKLNARREESQRGLEYALPSEAQWEYSCRGGVYSSTLPFHFSQPSNSLSSDQANFNGQHPYGGANEGPSPERTTEVGTYEPNVLGLYDMHGNVWEWCADWFGEYPDDAAIDPTGPLTSLFRVARGGGGLTIGAGCRSAGRFCDFPTSRLHTLGFRVVLVPVAEPGMRSGGPPRSSAS